MPGDGPVSALPYLCSSAKRPCYVKPPASPTCSYAGAGRPAGNSRMIRIFAGTHEHIKEEIHGDQLTYAGCAPFCLEGKRCVKISPCIIITQYMIEGT